MRRLDKRLPATTIRLRLTALYGTLFLVSGAALLAITYVLVAHELNGRFFITNGRGVVAGAVSVQVTKADEVISVGRPNRLFTTPVVVKKPTPDQLIAQAHAQSTAAQNQILVDSGIALAIMAVLSIWLGWLVAGRALRPLRTITNAAREISATNLHRRLALTGPNDEVKQLGSTFDELLGRLETAFDAQRRFVANASHELRTPLTYERTLLEVALADPNADEQTLRDACTQVLAVGEQQERLIEALLTLSRSQRGLEERHTVDLAAITGDTLRTTAHDGLAFEASLEPALTRGDPRLIERLVANLVGNAVHHNVAHGRVAVRTRQESDTAVLTVANSGPVIRPNQIDRLFQPFQRLGADRTSTNGVGLGLSIVHAIATAHDATLVARPRPEGGLSIEVGFPT